MIDLDLDLGIRNGRYLDEQGVSENAWRLDRKEDRYATTGSGWKVNCKHGFKFYFESRYNRLYMYDINNMMILNRHHRPFFLSHSSYSHENA
jgi:hypothetical protein